MVTRNKPLLCRLADVLSVKHSNIEPGHRNSDVSVNFSPNGICCIWVFCVLFSPSPAIPSDFLMNTISCVFGATLSAPCQRDKADLEPTVSVG